MKSKIWMVIFLFTKSIYVYHSYKFNSALKETSPQLTVDMLSGYINKTFGPEQHCLWTIINKKNSSVSLETNILYKTVTDSFVKSTLMITVINSTNKFKHKENEQFCAALVVIVNSEVEVEDAVEEFRHNEAERMLLVILRSTKFSLKKMYTPEYFKYKDLIIVIVDWEKETAYQLDLYYKNLIKFSLKQENWFNYKLNGERKIKNFHGAKVKVFAFNNSLFNTVNKNPITGNLELIDGVEGYLFNEISRLINIKVEVIIPINNSDKWGIRLPNGSYTLGATRRLQTKVVDIALASLWIEYFKINSVEMSHYWSEECLKLLVPKPPLTRNKWDLLFKPFPLSIWLLLFAVTLLNILTLWIVAVIQRKIKYKHIDAFTSVSSSIFWLLGIMFLASFPVHTHRLGPIRHLLNWWCIFIFIIAIAFSSVLYSYITSPEYTNLATSIEEMEKEDYTWGGLIDHATWTFVLKIENPIHKKFSVRFIPEKSIAERIDRLVNGKYAVCTKFINGKYFMEMQDLPPYLLSDLRTSRECLNSFYIGIGFTKNSPFLKPANIVIRNLLESGIINYWMNRIFEKKLPLNTFDRIFEQKPLAEKDSGPSPLTFDQYKVVIVVWLIGCILSSITFIFELKYGKVCVKDKKKNIVS